MKRIALLAILSAVAACGSDSPTTPTTGPIVFTAPLSAANEVPPVTNADANGRGTATITLNAPRDASGAITGAGTMNFSVQLSGFPAGTEVRLAHIHPGASGPQRIAARQHWPDRRHGGDSGRRKRLSEFH